MELEAEFSFRQFSLSLPLIIWFLSQESEEEGEEYSSVDGQASFQNGTATASGNTNFTEEVDIPPEVPPNAVIESEPPTTHYIASADVSESAPDGNINQAMMGASSMISQSNMKLVY